jgi:hypothetical protein
MKPLKPHGFAFSVYGKQPNKAHDVIFDKARMLVAISLEYIGGLNVKKN